MLLTVFLAFFAVFVAVMAIYFWLTAVKESPAAELKRRLRRMSLDARYESIPEDLRAELLKEVTPFETFVSRIPFMKRLDVYLDQCGFKIQPLTFLLVIVLAVVLSFLVAFIFRHSLLFAAFVAACVLVGACVYVSNARKKRYSAFTEQLPDALTMIARSLRAGHSLTSAVELVGSETPEPLGGLFRAAYEQQKLGLRITDALGGMLQRMDSLDLRFFVTVITIHAESGGNLSEILDKLAATIRERIKLRRQVQVYTAQGRMSGYILVALPIFAFFFLQYVMLPGYEDVFIKETKGHYAIAYAMISQIIGFLFIRRIINIRI